MYFQSECSDFRDGNMEWLHLGMVLIMEEETLGLGKGRGKGKGIIAISIRDLFKPKLIFVNFGHSLSVPLSNCSLMFLPSTATNNDVVSLIYCYCLPTLACRIFFSLRVYTFNSFI